MSLETVLSTSEEQTEALAGALAARDPAWGKPFV